nr:RNA-directed DNA polymerase, eukaryota [Tanacetum cinerariifolium]
MRDFIFEGGGFRGRKELIHEFVSKILPSQDRIRRLFIVPNSIASLERIWKHHSVSKTIIILGSGMILGFLSATSCQVRDGVERQQWDDLNSFSSSVTLSASKDRWICDLNGDGVFRVKDVHTILDDIFLPFVADATRWVKYIPIKINVFVWRASLDRLPTRSNLVRREVVLDSSLCLLCGLVPEDIHHVLFRCDTAKLVFRRICRWWDLDWHYLLSFSNWNAWFSVIRLLSMIRLIWKECFMYLGGTFGCIGTNLFLQRLLQDVQ